MNLNNPKKIWSTTRQATTQNTSNTSKHIRLKINNNTYNSNTDTFFLANEFNNYFLKMGNHEMGNHTRYI